MSDNSSSSRWSELLLGSWVVDGGSGAQMSSSAAALSLVAEGVRAFWMLGGCCEGEGVVRAVEWELECEGVEAGEGVTALGMVFWT